MPRHGVVPLALSVEDGAGIPRLYVSRHEWVVDGPCADLGPAPSVGGRGYLCTLDAGPYRVHEAWLDGRRVDSWPARQET